MITLVGPSLPYGFAKRHGVLLLDAGDVARVGLREGADPKGLIEARRVLGRPLAVEPLSQAAFDRQLSEIYAGDHLAAADGEDLDMPAGLDSLIDDIPAAADLLDTADDAPVIRLINGIIAEAVRTGASDIHLETYESALLVRMRIDGVLREALSLNPRIAPLLVSRIKVMARLDIAEKRVPQDGRIPLALGGKTLDVRVSTLPSRGGERVVMRILDKDQAGLTLDRLGMAPDALAAFRAALAEPNGIILVTGPTGSGKTTTLYTTLKQLATPEVNVCTIEDPIEMIEGAFNQMQVQHNIDLTFASGVRALMRQDPDIIMVGEIRDLETAEMAIQAALTGHLVISTLHTNDAPSAVTRLLELASSSFDFIVVDMPTTVVGWTETVLNAADVYFALLELDMRSAQNTLRMLRTLKAEELPFEKLRYVLNRAPGFTDLGGKARVKRMAESLDIDIDVLLPDGQKQVGHACDHGVPLGENSPKLPLRKEILKLSEQLRAHAADADSVSASAK